MIQKNVLVKLALSAVAAALSLTTSQAGAKGPDAHDPAYAVTKTLEPGGEGGWDFLDVDGARHRLYVARGDTVQVIDTTDGKLVDTLTGLHGTHGVAITPGAGFVTNGKNDSVTVFDLETHRAVTSIAGTGKAPDAIVYEPKQQRIYTMNHQGGSVSVIDAISRKLLRTISALPEMESGVTDGSGRLFVNSESENKIAVIDLQANKMIASWPLGGCDGPTGLAIDPAHHRLFSTCGNNKMIVVDSGSGHVITEVPIGARSDAAAFDPGLGMAYSSNGDGTLTVVHEDDPEHFRVVANVATQEGARTMALDPKTHALYLAAASYDAAPAATEATPHPRKPITPGSFRILVVTPTSR